jgi:NADP-dependent 3-hydroxy acid dehydrogenase YdfG
MTKKLEGKVAVLTGATSGMALATAKLFVEEGAYVFITGRRQEQLDAAVKEIGKNVTGVQGDAGNLADLDRLGLIVPSRPLLHDCVVDHRTRRWPAK